MSEIDDPTKDIENELTLWYNNRVCGSNESRCIKLNQWLDIASTWSSLCELTANIEEKLKKNIAWTKILTNPSHWFEDNKGHLQQCLSCYHNDWLRLAEHFSNGTPPWLRSDSSTTSRSMAEQTLIKKFTTPASFLSLIYFMDRVKIAHLLALDPCLFRADASASFERIRSSADMLQAFLRHCLPQGNAFLIRRGLQCTGYQLEHVDKGEEMCFDFSIHNLAEDLRTGVRLAKLTAILFGVHRWYHLMSSLKYPQQSLPYQLFESYSLRNYRLLMQSCLLSKFQQYESQAWGHLSDAQEIDNICLQLIRGYRQPTLQVLETLVRIEAKLIVERDYLQHEAKVINLQRKIKAWIEGKRQRCFYLKLRKVTIVFQKRAHEALATRRARARFLNLRKIARLGQRRWRMRRAWAMIISHLTLCLDKRIEAAVVLQKHFRGHRTRLQMDISFPELSQYRNNLRHRPPVQPKDTLQGRVVKILLRMRNRAKSIKTLATKESKAEINRDLLQNSFVENLNTIYQAVTLSKVIVSSIMKDHSEVWFFDYLAGLLTLLNRSEHHKTVAYYLLSILEVLLTTDGHRPASTKKASSQQASSARLNLSLALVQVSNTYFNYPLLLGFGLTAIAGLLAENGDLLVSKVSKDQRWTRLIETIRKKYNVHGEKMETISNTQWICICTGQMSICDELRNDNSTRSRKMVTVGAEASITSGCVHCDRVQARMTVLMHNLPKTKPAPKEVNTL